MKAQDMKFKNIFNGIWACASLLHVPSNELNATLKKCSDALKSKGIIYASFKYGSLEGQRNGRFFLDLAEKSIKKYLIDTNHSIIDTKITEDVRANRNTKWLNLILRKIN